MSVGIAHYTCENKNSNIRAVAQPGSAPRSGRGGRWFESSLPDMKNAHCSCSEHFYFDVLGRWFPACVTQSGRESSLPDMKNAHCFCSEHFYFDVLGRW